MQPYQKASQVSRESGEYPVELAKYAGGSAVAGGIARAGTAAVNKVIPRIASFLNKYIPENIAVKGLEKVDPRMGKFVEGALENGYDFDEVKNFLNEKIEKQQQSEKQENAKESRNIIEQYDPELHTYILENIKKGTPVMEAGEQALKHGRFKKAVDKITKDHKAPWSAILQTVYGRGEGQKTQQIGQPQEQMQQQQPQGGQGADWANIVNSLKQVLGE